ncbi:hypothetical protein SO802_002073 [Lithocarpus litseifolius]|uniref:Uncharacterized protein n=1 Tax=Lithocarpus litseifolius TaxID=425828 RepID=A0AAW2DXX0_9ROSI
MFYETGGGLNAEAVGGCEIFKGKIVFLSFGKVSNAEAIRLNLWLKKEELHTMQYPRYCTGYGSPANRSMSAHKNLLIAAPLPAQGALLTSVNHRGSSLCGHLAVVGAVRSLMSFRYSFKMKSDLAQTKTKALLDSSLYDPYQALSSSNPSLQALFTGIAGIHVKQANYLRACIVNYVSVHQ